MGIIYKWPVFRSCVKFQEANNDQMKSTEKMIHHDPPWSTSEVLSAGSRFKQSLITTQVSAQSK